MKAHLNISVLVAVLSVLLLSAANVSAKEIKDASELNASAENKAQKKASPAKQVKDTAALNTAADTSANKKVRPAKEPFKVSTALYKGEKMVGASVVYANFASANSQFFLLVNGLDARASLFRVIPFFDYCYKDNMAVGARIVYGSMTGAVDNVNMNLLSQELKLDLKDVKAKTISAGGEIYHRNYFGLDRKGNVALFLEESFAYSYNRLTLTSSSSATDVDGHRFMIGFAPGVLLYVLPNLSLQLSTTLADLGYGFSKSAAADGATPGKFDKWYGGVNLNLLNLKFGIDFHF